MSTINSSSNFYKPMMLRGFNVEQEDDDAITIGNNLIESTYD